MEYIQFMIDDKFRFLLVVHTKLNERIERAAAAYNETKTAFIRASILERLSKIDAQEGMKGETPTHCCSGSWIYQRLQGSFRAAYRSEGFWLLVQFVCGVEALYLISQSVRP